jgi:hypothetical protein
MLQRSGQAKPKQWQQQRGLPRRWPARSRPGGADGRRGAGCAAAADHAMVCKQAEHPQQPADQQPPADSSARSRQHARAHGSHGTPTSSGLTPPRTQFMQCCRHMSKENIRCWSKRRMTCSRCPAKCLQSTATAVGVAKAAARPASVHGRASSRRARLRSPSRQRSSAASGRARTRRQLACITC